LPVSVASALMPDAHQGNGLPIGGVLATDIAVIPYAVGADIARGMKLSVLDIPATNLKRLHDKLGHALEHAMMNQRADLVKIIARFVPGIVKMASEGEASED
jgi:RNA-splicing ligase RtcB